MLVAPETVCSMMSPMFVSDSPSRARATFSRFSGVPAGVRHFTSRDSAKNKAIQADYPRRLVLAERTGVLQGPLSYLASRWEGRNHDNGGPTGRP